MNKDEYLAATKAVFSHSSAGSGNLAGFVNYTNDGVVAIGGDDVGRLGFGIASGITLDTAVMSVVEEVNRLMSYGHYWLAEGADDANWSLVCGFKFPYELFETQAIIEFSAGLMQHSSVIANAVRQKLGTTPHRPYWIGDASADAQALVLIGHIG